MYTDDGELEISEIRKNPLIEGQWFVNAFAADEAKLSAELRGARAEARKQFGGFAVPGKVYTLTVNSDSNDAKVIEEHARAQHLIQWN